MQGFDSIPRDILTILETLEKNGYDAWLVGGCVRDIFSGRQPRDYDIASSALPEQTAALFAKTRFIGEKYGTVTVFYGACSAEVTTFRKEAGYRDFRRPSEIVFSQNIAEDLSRRDFTVNAVAYHPKKGVFDPFGGCEDLTQGLIRAVGDPEERFREDALRILRAFRFSAEHSYKIEWSTYRAAIKNASLIGRLSFERVKAEFDRMLLSENPDVIYCLTGLTPFSDIFSRVRTSQGNGGRLSQSPCTLRCRWAAFLFIAKADISRVSARFKFDVKLRNDVAALLGVLIGPMPETRVEIKQMISVLPPDIVRDAMLLAGVLLNFSPEPVLATLEDILRSGEPYRLSMLAIDGDGLKMLGVKPGPEYGFILKGLLRAVLENPNLNSPPELSVRARSLHNRFQGEPDEEIPPMPGYPAGSCQ